MSRLCLSLTGSEIDLMVSQVMANQQFVDLVEFRVDLLAPHERQAADDFPIRLAERLGRSIPIILSIRTLENGGMWGHCDETESERLELMVSLLLTCSFSYVEMETVSDRIIHAANRSGTRVIRSRTDLTGDLLDQPVTDLVQCIKVLKQDGAIPRLAVTCRHSQHLYKLASLAQELKDVSEKILLGLGEYGVPTRILAEKFGSSWTYSHDSRIDSLPPSSPESLNPESLCNLYRFKDIDQSTPLYAVTGNPVAHSQSPRIHNSWLQKHHLPGTYLPVLSNDLGSFLETCLILGISGLSVTIPHKETALILADRADNLAMRLKAANTLVYTANSWYACNTDITGFIQTLVKALNLENKQNLEGKKILVIGAGGTGRAVAHGLAYLGAHLVILNRTPEKAAVLAAETGGLYGSLEPESRSLLSDVEIAIQTTSVGMAPNTEQDPLPWWDPSSCSLVYDVIYDPVETVLLRRAASLGVAAVNGGGLLKAQAIQQIKLFTGADPDGL